MKTAILVLMLINLAGQLASIVMLSIAIRNLRAARGRR